MGIVRNNIYIEGLTLENDLPGKIKGQLVEFTETEYIYIPENRFAIRTIDNISIKVAAEPGRTINAPTGRIVVLDGIKKINITYKTMDYYQNIASINFEVPFNNFIDIPNNCGDLKKADIYVVDAYFKLINSRQIYCHILYMMDANHDVKSPSGKSNTTPPITLTTMGNEDFDREHTVYTDTY
jgi:hypothetical protein